MSITRRKRVLLVRTGLGQGGADRVTLTLLEQLSRERYELMLGLMRAEGTLLPRVPRDVEVLDLGSASLWSAWISLSRTLRRIKPDIIFSTCSGMNMPAVVARAVGAPKARLVLSERNVLLHGNRHPKRLAQVPIKAVLYRFADGITAVSEGVRADLMAKLFLPLERVQIVYNPVVGPDVIEAAKEPVGHPFFNSDVPVVVAAGRLVDQKDHATLLRAFAKARARHPARLLILGEGPLRESLMAHAKALRISEDFDLPGFDENPFRYMARAGAFVLSSTEEGLPGALIQAMALGAPCVSTNCPAGPSEIISQPGDNGFLVNVGDDEAMGDHLAWLLANPSKARAVGEKGRDAVQKFCLEQSITRYEVAMLGGYPDCQRP
ncbi:glycosyltransferase [Ectothiorhodospira variabilis]|uniref:glycosyltransferase n=1 Tax=Ectothiorhodospira variabilis TaxID=505694 RepID=UPI001EFB04B3|nr:glycosyltransferase [Ectothiorhodospira variabilis]MCG5497799.1 glycosyltransferase [Ectothiorhodospira variabilis]